MSINTNPQVSQIRPSYAPSYNAVQINMSTPTVNAGQAPVIYDYPQAQTQAYYPPLTQPSINPIPQQPAAQKPTENRGYAPKEDVPAPSVVKPQELQPKEPEAAVVDMEKVVSNLSSPDFDVQARQMDEIAKKGMTNSADAVPYIEEDVFNKLIEIIDTDSSKLEGPSEQQLELRAKVAENDMAKANAEKEGKDPNSVQLPHQLSEQDIELANKVTPLEQAERNKEYALFTTAILQKAYGDEIEKRTGNVVPLTDLPCAAQVVNELKTNENPAIRTAAIDSLRYVQRPEYKEDLSKIYSIAKSDADDTVSLAAEEALKSLEA